ncbi:UBP1-associated protein 2B [Manihot esculenta]|uniref:RRM domain-containing protein n=1 Tax=Manihot esculenta TaxID=3983 RepID=A0A2C9V7X9_MANES|nr:UBP1-associated protein 2B [Manihot esculenta]OAY40178.1 hypothetical protein MANES_09G002000v8 [Manihot esculenta]
MAKKRKNNSKSTEPDEPPKKQQQKQKQKQEIVEHDNEEEEYEEFEEEVDEMEEEGDKEEDYSQLNSQNYISSDLNQVGGSDYDEEDEPIENLLEPFGKEQLASLLQDVAHIHQDVADEIRRMADKDPMHRKIFVHGLGWDTNTETLMNAFKPYGEIEECKAVCDKVSGKSKGYGFVLFRKRSGARKALKQPQKKIGNRMTACQLASIGPVPAVGAAAPAQQGSEYNQRKIYVSNVGSDVDPQKLTTFFSKYGEIEEGPLGLDKATGKPKGFCLFVYRTITSAKKALEEPHKNFEGHIIHCQKAIDGPKPGKNVQQKQQHNVQNSHFQRNDNPAYVGGTVPGPAHLMAPSARPGTGFNQGAGSAAAPALNPALGQALTALLATQGAGFGLTNLLGTLGSAASVSQVGVPVAAPGMQGVYGNPTSISPGVIGSYGNQGVMQGGYTNQQLGQGSSGKGQHGLGQYGGVAPYMGQ